MVQTGQQFSSFIPYQEPSRYKQSNEHHAAQNHDQQKVGILAVLESVDDFLSLSHASLDAAHKQGAVWPAGVFIQRLLWIQYIVLVNPAASKEAVGRHGLGKQIHEEYQDG